MHGDRMYPCDRIYPCHQIYPCAGRLLAVGGMTGTRKRLATVEAFDPREGSWQQLPPMSACRSSCAGTFSPLSACSLNLLRGIKAQTCIRERCVEGNNHLLGADNNTSHERHVLQDLIEPYKCRVWSPARDRSAGWMRALEIWVILSPQQPPGAHVF